MRNKTASRYLRFTCLSLIFLFTSSSADGREKREHDNTEKSFYATSSLQFLLEEITSQEISDNDWTEEDIHHLWSLAASYPNTIPRVDEAKQLFDTAKNEDTPEISLALYQESYTVLQSVWGDLDSLTLECQNNGFSSLPSEASVATYAKKLGTKRSQKKSNLPSGYAEKTKPYLLPSNHPAKQPLDAIFAQPKVTKNLDTLTAAGFITVSIRPFSFAIIAKHPDLPGYLEKLYVDSELRKKNGKEGWEWLVQRCQGADNIRNLIQKKNLQYFSVPDKWIYTLPTHSQKNRDSGQPCILLVTDMDLVSQEESDQAWKSIISYEHLDELYVILSHGFASSHVSWNIPYSKSGKFSCIDTEHPKRKPNYKEVENYLSDEMKTYWKSLVKTGGNPHK